MADEELRKFCVEQAVLIITGKEQFKPTSFRSTESMSLFELSEIIIDYIKTGKKGYMPISLTYLK